MTIEYGTQACPICGKQIQTGHNLSEHNFRAHIEACPKQQSRKYLKQQRRAVRQAARNGMGSTAIPGSGQLGFPFQDVPEEVRA